MAQFNRAVEEAKKVGHVLVLPAESPGQKPRMTIFSNVPQPVAQQLEKLHKHLHLPATKPLPKVEALYSCLLRGLPSYVSALVRITLAGVTDAYTADERFRAALYMHPDLMGAVPSGGSVHRHRSVVLHSVASILLKLLQVFRHNNTKQSDYLESLLQEKNTVPTILKLLNQSLQAVRMDTSRQGPVSILYRGSYQGMRIKDVCNLVAAKPHLSDQVCERKCSMTLNMLRILRKIVRYSPRHAKLLAKYNAVKILIRYAESSHEQVKYYALKLIKSQYRYYDSEWRKGNVDLIATVQNVVPMNVDDQWLVPVSSHEHGSMSTFWELTRQDCEKFNAHYTSFDKKPVMERVEILLKNGDEVPQGFNLKWWLDGQDFWNKDHQVDKGKARRGNLT